MKRQFAFVALLALACSASDATGPEQTFLDGQLRLTVSDSLAVPGFLFAKPQVTAGHSALVVTSTRYGSLCAYDVLGHADVSGNSVVLRITYSPRLTLCTGEIRKLSYKAEITGLAPKTYDVRVIHTENNVSDTLVTQPIAVP